MEKKPEDVHVIAANLTAAAHVHILSMQLRGERVTLSEALEAVTTTYRHLLANPSLLGATQPAPAQGGTALPPRTTEPIARGAADATAVATDPPITLDGRYRILRALGAGGMGQVYLGEQLSTGRTVALKMLPALAPEDLPAALSFFRQEAAALAKLNHPNIAQVYDASIAGNHLFIAMEYVEGEALRDRLTRDRILPLAEAIRIIREACKGLEAAHRAGIIHRDIKPENLMLVRDQEQRPQLKILDFGLAILDNKDALDNVTGAGMIAGTPTYMSPEQVSGLEVTPATDVYSLGVVAYEMLTGVNPFRGANPWQTMQNHMRLQPPPIRDYNPQVPPELEEIILRALEKEPGRRFADGGQWRLAL